MFYFPSYRYFIFLQQQDLTPEQIKISILNFTEHFMPLIGSFLILGNLLKHKNFSWTFSTHCCPENQHKFKWKNYKLMVQNILQNRNSRQRFQRDLFILELYLVIEET